jgi:hypothetical protein
MPDTPCPVVRVALPGESRATRFYASTDLEDAYAVRLPEGASADPEVLARFLFSHQAPWVAGLLRLRDALVAGFGLKTAAQLAKAGGPGGEGRIGIFRIYEIHAHEILLGEDDKHLDFRLSVLRQLRADAGGGSAPHLVLSTVVHCHNLPGRAYILLIAPFHRQVVQSALRRAARAGWPMAAGA